jgi:hypothetical protein
MSERTVDAGRAIAHRIYAPINRWTESDALDPMFEKPQKAQVVRIEIEVVSLGSTSMAPSLDGPLVGRLQPVAADGALAQGRQSAQSINSRNGHNASRNSRRAAMAAFV